MSCLVHLYDKKVPNLTNTFSSPQIEVQLVARVSGAENISKVHIWDLRNVLRD